MIENRKKAAFVDYSCHKKTQSSKFLKELLSKDYDIEEIWVDDWKSQKKSILNYLNKNIFHTVFFFQCLFSPAYLKRLNCNQAVWFPMYDSEEFTHFSSYSSYLGLNLKIFSFSNKLHYNFKKAGLESYYYKYYPEPSKEAESLEGKKVFFWVRTYDVTWDTLKKLIGNSKIEKTILQISPDPGYEKKIPSKEDIIKYNIQIFEGWLSKSEHLNLLSSCNIFVAPRRSEGIGMSFLDAMAQGMCVIAANNSTMNEYIASGSNGYLFDIKNPHPLDFCNFTAVKEKSKEDLKRGYLEWEKEKNSILNDLNNPHEDMVRWKMFYTKIANYPRGVILVNFVKVVRNLKNKIKITWTQKRGS